MSPTAKVRLAACKSFNQRNCDTRQMIWHDITSLFSSTLVSRAGLEPATTALKVQIRHLSVYPDALFSVVYRLSRGHRKPPKDKKVAKSDAKSNWLCCPCFPPTEQPRQAKKLIRSKLKDRALSPLAGTISRSGMTGRDLPNLVFFILSRTNPSIELP